MKARKISSLTSLRFFAAALIVVFHTQREFGYFGLAAHFSLPQAVSLFFVLSGYILAHTHNAIESKSELALFYVKRIAKIWPLHLVGACVAFWLIRYDGGPIMGLSITLNALLLHAWSVNQDTYFSLNGVSWSLSVEAFFYAIFPFLIWRIRTTWFIKMIGTFLLTGIVLIVFKHAGLEWIFWSGYVLPLTRLSEFMMGIAAYQVSHKFASILRDCAVSTFYEAGAVIITFVVMWITGLKSVSAPPESQITPFVVWFVNCGACLPFAAIITIFALERGILSRALRFAPIVYLGEISFALYVVHELVFRFMEQHANFTREIHPSLVGMMYWALTLLCAAVAHHFIETPVQRAMISLFRNGVNFGSPSKIE